MCVFVLKVFFYSCIHPSIHPSIHYLNPLFSSCVPPERLSVADGEAAVKQLAQTLQACVELKDPVQQVKLVKKVGLAASAEVQSENCFSHPFNEPSSVHIVPGRVPAEMCD